LAGRKKPEDAGGAAGDQSLAEAPSTIFNDALRLYGLELRSRKLPVDVLVVDEAQTDPTPN
jgi:uncharacterized protein (TIGR03435 family)